MQPLPVTASQFAVAFDLRHLSTGRDGAGAAETETGQLASDGPGPPTESPTTHHLSTNRVATFPSIPSFVLTRVHRPLWLTMEISSPQTSFLRSGRDDEKGTSVNRSEQTIFCELL